jgi:outer membrane protein OmpA-like peptidoglycan-associated protein
MLIRRTILRTIAFASCCLSLTGCWGKQPNKKAGTFVTKPTHSIVHENNARESSIEIKPEQTIYYFHLNSDILSDQVKYSLNQLATYLKKHPEINIVLEGHADAQGPDTFNEFLAKQRGNSVRSYLQQQEIPGAQIEVYGHSNRELAVLGDSEAAHAKNRRVELKMH